jgi:hypothetical protein
LNQACIWCKNNNKNKYETEKEWPINRTIEEALKTLKTGSANVYTKQPMMTSIPIDHYVIDMLHLFLRVSDRLFKHMRQDRILKSS